MLKNNLYVYGERSVSIPAHCNYGMDIFDKMRTFRNSVALVDADSGQTMTYLEVIQQTVDIAISLSQMGIKKGDVIGICSEKRVEVIPAMLGIVCAGATCSPLDLTCGDAKFMYRLNMSRPRTMFCSPLAYSTHEDSLRAGGVRDIVMFGEHAGTVSFSQLIDKGTSVDQFLPATVDGWNDNAFLIFSSGTSDLPKGIKMTHFSFLVLNSICTNGKMYFEIPMLSTREWYYTYGLLHTLASLYAGSTVVFSPNNQLEDISRAIQDYKIQTLQVCPTTINELVKSTVLDKYDVSSLKYVITGSTPCDARLLNAVRNRLPNLHNASQLYGMTEAGGVCSFQGTPPGSRVGSVGRANAGVVIKVVDLNTREPLGPNQRGEICIKSLTLMKGYIGRVDEDYLDEERFFKTGDIGYYDDDKFFYIVDRVRDMIKYKDILVAPAEIEALLLQHSAVREAGVVGAPHPMCGEVPTAFVVLQPGEEMSAEDLINYINKQMSYKTKLEGGIRFVDKLPRGAGQKLDRKALKLML